MRLKNLSIKGFKSFANETSLNFQEDVIGVVGPNGSGKSNVVDAIRWVLGEQKSKELRLEKMSDVLFNGTKKRKESGSATVTLTFENDKGILPTEYNTVAISRILYRTGESEYRLNGVSCRLKDINALLMDTGIGSNSYAIIALGMVDDILADKENARRRMFEQAAGISKYKKRKKETLNKLRGTKADLDRVEDLLFEIENNLKSLEKQAKRAKKYLDLKAQYKEYAIYYAQVSMQVLKDEYKRLGTELRNEQDKYSGLDVQIRKLEAQLEKEKKGNVEKEQSLTDSQKKLNALVSEIRNLESEKSLLDQKQKFKEANAETLVRTIESSENDLKELEKSYAILKERVEEERIASKTLKAEVEVLKSKYEAIKGDYTDAKKAHDDRVVQRERINKSIYDHEKQLALLKNNHQNIQNEIERSAENLKNRKEEFKSSKDQLTKIEEDIAKVVKKLDHLQSEEETRQNAISQLEEKREQYRTEIGKTNRIIDSKQNEFDLLKSMIDNFEGFPESIKFLSTKWKNDVPVLSDLLEVEEEYKPAIEQYLSNYLNYYVVDHEKEAKTAIKLLQEAQKGKANFFLLNAIPEEQVEELAIPDCELAITKVNIEDKYRNLLKYILKDVYIYSNQLDDFDLNNLPKDKVYLSKSGNFLKGSNYISGGSIGLFEGKKIGRKKNLDKLSKDLKKLESQIEKQKETLDKTIQELNELKKVNNRATIQQLQQEKNKLENQRASLTTRLDVYKQYKKEHKEKEEAAEKQLQKIVETTTHLESELKKFSKDLKNLDQVASGETNIESLNNILSIASQKYNENNIKNLQQQNLVENLSKDLDFKQNRIDDIKLRIKQDSIRRKDELEAVKDIAVNLENIEKSLVGLYETKKEKENKLSEAEQKYYAARSVISEIEDEIRKITRNQNQIQLKVQQIRDQYTDVKFKINAVGERLKIEFNISINDIINDEVTTELTEEELTEKVEKLKSRLSNYGDVNPMAVEAYDEMEERYNTITKQRDDILEAKDSLIKTIKEIEDSATALFLEAFDKVRINFIEVFRSLFSEEDTCDLLLLEPDNPLESPIEIVAKPKGKKPRSLSQLSGGEKTLTATALLFALYLLKPAPFCIFDEVDAPLDDANILKFNKIIKKFSKKSQFIIVTHNKSTMSAVDILYGVYMPEPGVSSVTPVDFRNFDDIDELQAINN